MPLNIEAEIKWPQISKCLNLDENLTELCSQGSNQQYSSIGSDNGWAPTRRQAIIWTNAGLFTDGDMRHSASMGLTNPWQMWLIVQLSF